LIVSVPLSLLLANAVLVVHVAVAAFVVVGLVFVIVGNLLHWRLANNLWRISQPSLSLSAKLGWGSLAR